MTFHSKPIRAGTYAVWTNRYGREVMVRVLSVGPEKAWVIRKEKHRAVVLLEKLRPYEAANV